MSENHTTEGEAYPRFRRAKDSGDYEVLYQIPAGEDWGRGDHVGFIRSEGWTFAVSWRDGEIAHGQYALEPGEYVYFPHETWWMITTNEAIDYDIAPPEDRNGGVPDDGE